jgi:hypothetical protein
MVARQMQGVSHKGVEYLWLDRRPGPAPEAIGPTYYALYLLDFAGKRDPEVLGKCLAWLEKTLIKTADGKPVVRTHQPRAPRGLDAAATMRLALVYLKSARKAGSAAHRKRARQLLGSVLAMADPETGLIWAQPAPKDWTAYVRSDQHPYTAYKAELARNLHEFITLMEGG